MLAAEMSNAGLAEWLDHRDENSVAAFSLDDGERLTGKVLEFGADRVEFVVSIVSSNRRHPNRDRRRYAIPITRVTSFEPLSRVQEMWPKSDPCRSKSFSFGRFVLLTALLLGMFESVLLFVAVMKRPYGVQVASAIGDTFAVAFLTFAGVRGERPFMFSCPAVKPKITRLLWRHTGFLAVLFAMQTVALTVRPYLSDWWNTKTSFGRSEETPFAMTLLLLSGCLVFIQVHTNRSLIDQAHADFKP